jgi:hypothetical protein
MTGIVSQHRRRHRQCNHGGYYEDAERDVAGMSDHEARVGVTDGGHEAPTTDCKHGDRDHPDEDEGWSDPASDLDIPGTDVDGTHG